MVVEELLNVNNFHNKFLEMYFYRLFRTKSKVSRWAIIVIEGEENLFGINFEHEEKVFIYMIFMRL